MLREIVLFCGGKHSSEADKPKPLKLMPNKLTLLETFLSQPSILSVPQITFLSEAKYLEEIESKVERSKVDFQKFEFCEVPESSTTLEKIEHFSRSSDLANRSLLFTYPDIFYFGNWDKLLMQNRKIGISGVYLQSRFSFIHVDSYSERVRSVNLRPTRVPANAPMIFAGHFSIRGEDLVNTLTSFVEKKGSIFNFSLEGDYFKYLVGKELLDVVFLEGKWIKADSNNEMQEIVNLLGIAK